jgi:hypothetical protein
MRDRLLDRHRQQHDPKDDKKCRMLYTSRARLVRSAWSRCRMPSSSGVWR